MFPSPSDVVHHTNINVVHNDVLVGIHSVEGVVKWAAKHDKARIDVV